MKDDSPIPPVPKIDPKYRRRKTSTLLDTDRGRLFVKILGISDVGLEGIEKKYAKFNMVLDNGLHSITTPFTPLKKNSDLDQEFELVVGSNLEFILTLKAKWSKNTTPASPAIGSLSPLAKQRVLSSRQSTISMLKSEKRSTGFSKLFGSKKKSPLTNSPLAVNRSTPNFTTHNTNAPNGSVLPLQDPWDDMTAVDGSFARMYIAFSQYEKEIYGKVATFEVPCYNEWTVKSDTQGKKKKEPYQIALLKVQMMFIPRASKAEALPGSIKEAVSELQAASKVIEQESIKDREDLGIKLEGYMSQLGGDCKYLRRRLFKLENTTLTAYSESSHKPRAIINLKKGVRIEDTDVGGFRVMFKNGESIEFYTENMTEWIQKIQTVIDNKEELEKLQKEEAEIKPWVALILDNSSKDLDVSI